MLRSRVWRKSVSKLIFGCWHCNLLILNIWRNRWKAGLKNQKWICIRRIIWPWLWRNRLSWNQLCSFSCVWNRKNLWNYVGYIRNSIALLTIPLGKEIYWCIANKHYWKHGILRMTSCCWASVHSKSNIRRRLLSCRIFSTWHSNNSCIICYFSRRKSSVNFFLHGRSNYVGSKWGVRNS